MSNNLVEQLAFRSAQSLLALKKDHVRRILHIQPPAATPQVSTATSLDPVVAELERSVADYLRKTVDKFDLTKSVEVRGPTFYETRSFIAIYMHDNAFSVKVFLKLPEQLNGLNRKRLRKLWNLVTSKCSSYFQTREILLNLMHILLFLVPTDYKTDTHTSPSSLVFLLPTV